MALSTADAAHLLRRSGFGVTPAALAELTKLSSRAAAVDRVTDLSRNPVMASPPSTAYDPDWYGSWLSATTWWLERMRTSPVPIVEKMTLFWHGHFVSGVEKVGDMGLLAGQHLTMRQHALGDFHALTQAMAVDPAMLRFLDNYTNVAGKPQENFARELMELFTLGVGQYTQEDVVSMTRAWTGHSLDDTYRRYQFRSAYHDNGTKKLFGRSRNWDGPATITELLLGSKAIVSSQFITAKVFSYLAYPVAPTDPVVVPIAKAFRTSGLSILALVRAIFNSTAFWSAAARRSQVRSPVEFFVAGLQALELPVGAVPPQFCMGQAGQLLWFAPDVSGWGRDAYWLSTAGMWGRSQWAAHARAAGSGVFSDLEGLTPAEMVQRGFDRFGITHPAPSTRAALEACCDRLLAAGHSWTIAPQLMQLLLLSPDFQIA